MGCSAQGKKEHIACAWLVAHAIGSKMTRASPFYTFCFVSTATYPITLSRNNETYVKLVASLPFNKT